MTALSGPSRRRSSASRGDRRSAGGRRGRGSGAGPGPGPGPGAQQTGDGLVPAGLEAAGEAANEAADGAPGPPEDDKGDPEAVARAICLRALTGAPKTRKQLADLLGRRGVPEAAAVAVLDRFDEVGLIDDAAFARMWVGSRQAGRGLARRALRAELQARGVAPEVAADAVELIGDDDERAAARRLAERRARSMQRLDRATASRRLMGMLARKGYSGGLSAAVVREVLDAADTGSDAGEPEPW